MRRPPRAEGEVVAQVTAPRRVLSPGRRPISRGSEGLLTRPVSSSRTSTGEGGAERPPSAAEAGPSSAGHFSAGPSSAQGTRPSSGDRRSNGGATSAYPGGSRPDSADRGGAARDRPVSGGAAGGAGGGASGGVAGGGAGRREPRDPRDSRDNRDPRDPRDWGGVSSPAPSPAQSHYPAQSPYPALSPNPARAPRHARSQSSFEKSSFERSSFERGGEGRGGEGRGGEVRGSFGGREASERGSTSFQPLPPPELSRVALLEGPMHK